MQMIFLSTLGSGGHQDQQVHRPIPTVPINTPSRMETPVLNAPDRTFQHLHYVNTACLRPPKQKRPAPQPPDQENSHRNST